MSVVDSATKKLLIKYTALRYFIPPQISKMTHKLRHICRYELCIIPKDTQLDLNISRTRIVTDLQQKYIRRHTNSSLFSTKSDAHYKNKLFTDGECLHDTIKYASQ